MMNRTEALQKFHIEVVLPAKRRTIQQIDSRFREGHEAIFEDFLKNFLPFVSQLREIQKPVSHLQISWLRTSIFDNGPLLYLFEAYSEAWYADIEEVTVEWEYDWLAAPVNKLYRHLLEASTKFGLLEGDVRNVIYEIYPQFNRYVQEAIHRGLCSYRASDLLGGLNLCESWTLRMGEYLDYSEKLIGNPITTSNHAKRQFLKQQKEEAAGEDFTNVCVKKVDLSHGQYSYATFVGADLSDCDFSESVFQNANFREAILDGVNFGKSILADSQFQKASLCGADFRLCKGNIADLNADVPCLFGVDFREADLRSADFRMSALKGADFTGAAMDGAKFLLRDKDTWCFSDEQKQAIDWYA
ncbi:pentapeptide repeat-containing protein [Listeria booriae]|uniref:pentapeptide repeat-containing protein n=1 Tax=Listeria booriae TaxID=1552123 RepID=UPI001623BDED|nr:pentapeptide repeat-containing protein [Listeria booriae]